MQTKYRTVHKALIGMMIAGVLLAMILNACAQAPRSFEKGVVESGAPANAPSAGFELPQAAQQDLSAAPADQALTSSEQTNSERLVIKTSNLSLIVPDPAKSMDLISKMADEMGGFVVSANLYTTIVNEKELPRASITIRVPSEKLNEALKRIKAESDQLPQNETINSQDVTSEYTDLASRLRNLEAAEAQLQEIMKNAFSTDDVLKIYNQLVQTREQIELIKGQMKYYEESAALSAISVDLVAKESVQPLTIGGWQPVGIARDALQALISTLKVIVTILIWLLLNVLPTLLIIFAIFILPFIFLFRLLRKRKKPVEK